MYIIINSEKYHASQDAVKEFETEIIKQNQLSYKIVNNSIHRIIYKLSKKLGAQKLYYKLYKWIITEKEDYFTILMSSNFYKCLPYFFSKGKNGIYIYDAWPSRFDQIDEMILNFNFSFIFFSSKQVAKLYQDKYPKIKIKWVPEAIAATEYMAYDYNKKDIDVLQLGRKYDKYHEEINNELQRQGINYLFEKEKGKIIFEDKEKLIDGLARTKISICVPSNITHPERSGNISTVTLRYYQSMMSKCLIVGKSPDEMKDLFPYNPIIEIDEEDPIKQIVNILANFKDYIPLIEKNYMYVLENHSWKQRVKDYLILTTL